ncbi:hypothetical protein GCM10023191_025920 [Actinoallomurus oryzae]|uniref:Uncharacterized protein n=1 Tax=Actinoallomurus oryzae TaxID=502180 RepID=A0ABP8PUM9_9ACTN
MCPIHSAETGATARAVFICVSAPTVIATPAVTCLTMFTLADACPFEPAATALDGVRDSAVMPVRYCAGWASAGTAIRNRKALRSPWARVMAVGSPVTQQLAPVQPPGVFWYAEPELAAVTPWEMVIFRRWVRDPVLLMIAVSRAVFPGGTVRLKYERGRPVEVEVGVRPNEPPPTLPPARAGTAVPAAASASAAMLTRPMAACGTP